MSRFDRWTALLRKAKSRPVSFLAWKAFDVGRKRTAKYERALGLGDVAWSRIAPYFRAGWSADLRDYLLRRQSFRFFFSQAEVGDILSTLSQSVNGYQQEVVARADRICGNILPVLGTGEMYLGESIDWLRDYRSGLRWEPAYAFDYNLLDPDRPTDVRVVWELNRLHFLVDLGKAYRLTGDRKYVLKFRELD